MTDVFVGSATRQLSPVADRVRVTLRSSHTQAEVSLPSDVPVAILTHSLRQLLSSEGRGVPERDTPTESERRVWTIRRFPGGVPLEPSATLREAGIADGALLHLTAEPTFVAPTHHDDVVDAAAHLTRTGHPGWGPAAAQHLTFGGIYLICAAWMFLLLSDSVAPRRAAVVGLSTMTVVGLAAAATLATRSFGREQIGIALGWAALPVAVAITWVAVGAHGGYTRAAGCAALIVIAWGLHRLTGVGRSGYLAAAVLFASGGALFAAHTAGVPSVDLGIGAAVVGVLSGAAIPRAPRHTTGCAHDDDPWMRIEAARRTRSGLYVGQTVTVGIGAVIASLDHSTAQWPAFVFSLVCAGALGLQSMQATVTGERAASLLPAAALVLVTCVVAARSGATAMPLVALAVVLTVALTCVALACTRGRVLRQGRVTVAYVRYVVAAVLIPSGLWVVGALDRLGLS